MERMLKLLNRYPLPWRVETDNSKWGPYVVDGRGIMIVAPRDYANDLDESDGTALTLCELLVRAANEYENCLRKV